MKRLAWLLLAFLIVGSRLGALPYILGDNVVDLEIRNTAMIPILQKWISIKEHHGNIRVSARADGYVTRKIEITGGTGQKLHRLDLVLEDEPRHILVRDTCGAPIASAYVDKSQFGFPSDVYGITIGIPKKLLPHPNPKQIQVMSDLLWVPITKSCTIKEIEGFQQIRLTVDRGDYGATQRLISVVVAIAQSPFDPSEPGDDDDEEEAGPGSEPSKRTHETLTTWLSRLQTLEQHETAHAASNRPLGRSGATIGGMDQNSNSGPLGSDQSPAIAGLAGASPNLSTTTVEANSRSLASPARVKPGSSVALSELLLEAYPPACLEKAMQESDIFPLTLQKRLAQNESFRLLHRD